MNVSRDDSSRRSEELQDKFRVFNNGAGSYAIAAPKINGVIGPIGRGRSARA